MGCSILYPTEITDDFSKELQEGEFEINPISNSVECLKHTFTYQKLYYPDEDNPLTCSINEMNKSQLFVSLKSNVSTPQSKKSCLKQSSNKSLSKYSQNKKVQFDKNENFLQAQPKKHNRRKKIPKKIDLDEIF